MSTDTRRSLRRIDTSFSYYQMEDRRWCGCVGLSFLVFARSERKIRAKIAREIRRVRRATEMKERTLRKG